MADAFDACIDHLYGAATGDAPWTGAMAAVTDLLGYDGAALYVFDKRVQDFGRETRRLVRGLWHRLDPSGQDDYESHWFRFDPRVEHLFRHPHDRVLHDYRHTTESEMDRHPYYDWYFRMQPTRYYLGYHSAPDLPFLCGMTLHRRGALGPARRAEAALLQRLLPHLERALLTEYRLHRAAGSAEGTGFEPLLEQNPTGILLLDRQGRVLHANRAARRIADRQDALALCAEGLRALRAADQAALQRAIGWAVGGAVDGAAGPGVLRLARRAGGSDYLLSVMPVPQPAEAGMFAAFRPAACVLVVDPDAAPPVPERMLQVVFGLTRAEARVAALLAAGQTVTEAAASLGVSAATVRSHLSVIFGKTGTGRQEELLRLVRALPAGAA